MNSEAIAHAQRGFDLCAEAGLGRLRVSLGLTMVCGQALVHLQLGELNLARADILPRCKGSFKDLGSPRHHPISNTGRGQFEFGCSTDSRFRSAGLPPKTNVGKASHRILGLLKALAAMGGHSVPAELLADLIWPDADGDHARRSLETSVSRLRKMLQCDQALSIHDGKLSLNPDWVSLDLRSFNFQLARQGTLPLGNPDWQSAAQRAVDLYRRDLLADEADHEWLVPRRGALRKQWMTVAQNLVKAYEADGASAKAQRVREQIAGFEVR